MFIIIPWTIKFVEKKSNEEWSHTNKYCMSCKKITKMNEFYKEKYFTIFSLPIFKFSGWQEYLKCEICSSPHGIDIQDRYTYATHILEEEGYTVKVNCPLCHKMFRVKEVDKKEEKLNCAHCKQNFKFMEELLM